MVSGLVGLSVAGLLLFAFILEFFVDLIPCPLCIVQRFFYLLIGLVALGLYTGWIKGLTAWRTGLAIIIFALLGGATALRQVWLQRTETFGDPTRCGVSFGSFLDKVIQALGGLGNCAVVDWTFIGFSIAEWSLLWFILFFFVGMWLLLQSRTEEKSA